MSHYESISCIQQNVTPENEWDKQICQHLDELWELVHSPLVVFYAPDETRALMQGRISAAKAK